MTVSTNAVLEVGSDQLLDHYLSIGSATATPWNKHSLF
jgi:hypothetical protein